MLDLQKSNHSTVSAPLPSSSNHSITSITFPSLTTAVTTSTTVSTNSTKPPHIKFASLKSASTHSHRRNFLDKGSSHSHKSANNNNNNNTMLPKTSSHSVTSQTSNASSTCKWWSFNKQSGGGGSSSMHSNKLPSTSEASSTPSFDASSILGITPAHIIDCAYGFLPSAVLLASVELEIFTVLSTYGPMTHEELRDYLDLHPRASPDLPDCLLAFKLLKRKGTGDTALYCNSPEASLFLDKNKPQTYIGESLERCASLYRQWTDHASFLKGSPAHEQLTAIVNSFQAKLECESVYDSDKCSDDVSEFHSEASYSKPADKELTPFKILELGFSFWTAQALHTAVELSLFTYLEMRNSKKASGVEIAITFKVNQTSIVSFLDTLVKSKLLLRIGKEGNMSSLYYCTPESAAFLDKNKETYVGGIVKHFSQAFYGPVGDLVASLKTGQAQGLAKNIKSKKDWYDLMYNCPDSLALYTQAMQGLTRGATSELVKACKIKKAKTLVDIGGGCGQLAAFFARANPKLRCAVTERPEVVPLAEKCVAQQWSDAKKRITVRAHDFMEDRLPRADVVCMSLVLSEQNDKTRRELVRKAYKALPEFGALIILDYIVDDKRRADSFALSNSLLMISTSGAKLGSRCYTVDELGDWCQDAGFREVKAINLPGHALKGAIAFK